MRIKVSLGSKLMQQRVSIDLPELPGIGVTE